MKNKIKYYRSKTHESQFSLAVKLGVSPSAIGLWETGKRSPRDDTKVKIARHFGVRVEDIFFLNNPTNSGTGK